MIRYSLRCPAGHRFESWFRSASEYDRLHAGGHLSCATCGAGGVEKDLMAPRLATRETAESAEPLAPAGAAGERTERLLRALRRRIEAVAENVGTRFAAEARAIHGGEAPERPIIGQATGREARALIEDGIPITPLPWRDDKPN